MSSEELNKKFGVTDEQLEAWATEYESQDWSSMKFGESTPGRPKLYDEDMEIITIKVPHSRIVAMKKAAEQNGISRSEFIRRAIDHELSAIA